MRKSNQKILNCIAINPQWHDEYFLSFPLGIATIVSIVKLAGHNIQVVDFDAVRYEEDRKAAVLSGVSTKADVVLLTGMITNYKRIRDLSSLIKKMYIHCIVILGGSLATTAPDSILKKMDIDVFVIGEGDETIKILLETLSSKSSLRSVPGIKIKDNDNIYFTSPSLIPEIVEVPRPCYEEFPINRYVDFYKKTGQSFDIYTSKGCPSTCVYCYRISGNKVRYRAVNEVIKEILFIKESYQVNSFSFVDDNFGINKKWTYDFCDKVRDLNIRFRFQAFVNAFDENILDHLQKVGLAGVSVGMESASPLILKEMSKRINLDKAAHLFSSLRKRNIKYNATFIIGMPGENDESIEMTKEFLIHNGFTSNFQLFFITPYPGTKLYSDLITNGVIQDELEYIENLGLQDNVNINLTKYSLEKLVEWREYILGEVSPVKHAGATWKNVGL